ncbi:MAG: hypothetical protein JW850_03265 [Thermoflexales bacterium]|nr:hypothetical protein [Thermoflexales bacterium]
MNAVQILKALGPIDAHNVRRDAMLKWIAILPPVLALAMRWIIPVLFGRLSDFLHVDLAPYYSPFMGYTLALLTPAMVGVVVGFLLLDERDDRTLSALQVTPLSLNGYLAYRLLVPSVLSVILTVIVFPLSGLMEIDWLSLLWLSICSAPFAPLFALFMASFAQNKVQGFALQKAASWVFMPPVIAYFIQSNWQWAFGIVPTYWPAKLYWTLQAGQPHAWAYGLVGLAYQGLLLVLLVRRFNRVMTAGAE